MMQIEKINYAGAAFFFGLGVLMLGVTWMPETYRGTHTENIEQPLSLPVMSNSIAGDPSLYSAVSDRTIFVSNRHLPPAAIVKDADEPGVAEVATNFPFTLLGVMITQDKKIAVIKRDGDTEIMSLQVGQSLDAWTIEDIKNNHIILQSGDDKKSLSLADEKKNGAAQP